jgi:hypothetical protein
MAHKVFAVAQATEPVSFDLEGVNFRCRPRMAAGVILSMAEKLGGGKEDDDESGIEAVKAIRRFFKSALIPQDLKPFNDLLDDDEVAIPLETLTEIVSWLSEVYTARPTGKTSASTSQATSAGSNSTDGASAEVLTYSRSTQAELIQS